MQDRLCKSASGTHHLVVTKHLVAHARRKCFNPRHITQLAVVAQRSHVKDKHLIGVCSHRMLLYCFCALDGALFLMFCCHR